MATDYCVDNAHGSDANPGTCKTDQAWASINRANQGPGGPGSKYQPGDTISFRGGQTFEGTLSFSPYNSSWSDGQSGGAPITVTSYGDGRAVISSGDEDGLMLTNVSGFKIRDINLTGRSLRDHVYLASGIHFVDDLNADNQVKDLIIDGVDVGGYGLDGVAFWVTAKSTLAHVKVTNVVAHENGDGGVLMCGTSGSSGAISDVYVGHVVAFNNTGIPEPYADRACGSGLGLGIYFLGVKDGIVEYSTAHDNGSDSPHGSPNCGPTSIMANVSDHITFQFNEVYRSRAGGCGIDGNALSFESGVSNSVMQYNYAHANDGTGLMMFNSYNDLTYRYNIAENNARVRGAADLGIYGGKGPLRNVLIYNNTIYAGGNPSITEGAVLLWGPKGCRFEHIHLYNNIFHTAKGIPIVMATASQDATEVFFEGNEYWSEDSPLQIRWGADPHGNPVRYRSLSEWRQATGQEMLNGRAVGLETPPGVCAPGRGGTMFPQPLKDLSAYRLRPGSPMIDAGLKLPLLFGIKVGERDFYGSSIPDGPDYDLGAAEFHRGQMCR